MILSIGEYGLEGNISRSIGQVWLCKFYQSFENLSCRAFGLLTKRPEVQHIDRGRHLESKYKNKGVGAGKGGGASCPPPPLLKPVSRSLEIIFLTRPNSLPVSASEVAGEHFSSHK